MRKEDLNQIDDNYITQKLEEAFGYSDEQLIAELDRAAVMVAENPDPRLAAPEGEFEYWVRDRSNEEVVFNNAESINKQNDIELAYKIKWLQTLPFYVS